MIGSLMQLAARPGMPSEVTLRRLILRHPDFPLIRYGRQGRSYRIDLDQAEAFIRGLAERKRRDAEALREAVAGFYAMLHPNREEDDNGQ